MTTATCQPTASYRTFRDGKDLRCVFRSRPAQIGGGYPAGLDRFGTLSVSQHEDYVHVVCRGGDGSGHDLTPILVAADWIREQGWAVRQQADTPSRNLPHDD